MTSTAWTRRSLLGAVGGVAVAGTTAATVYGSSDDQGGERPTALVAGSLLRVAKAVPGASVEAHGSVAVRRLIDNGLREPDAVALADPSLFDGLADAVSLFATNALVLAYHPESAAASTIAGDWRAALTAPSIAVGRSDPAKDPLGYRTVMALKLAAREGDLDVDRALDGTSIHPETALINLVDQGRLDAAFAYRSMAVEHDLPFAELPARVDFSDPSLADHYASVTTSAGERTVRGGPIRYGAAAITPAGREWIADLVTGTDRLRESGFEVPDGYPNRGVPTGAVAGSADPAE